jgi:hypothetical protein
VIFGPPVAEGELRPLNFDETDSVVDMENRLMTLDEFEKQLAHVIGRPTDLRPFVCEGSPLDCDVFIVGYNPATAMEGDWWRFWKPGYGYRKSDWFSEYLAQRGGDVSKTRAKIQEIVHGLPNVRVLEANIDARPSPTKSVYPKPITRPFDFLLSVCRPKVVIAHSTDAVAHLQAWKPNGTLIECKHFIYVGRERTAEILVETRRALNHALQERFVTPLYLSLLNGNFVDSRDASVVMRAADAARAISDLQIEQLLDEWDWRTRLCAGWFIGLSRRTHFVPRIGALLASDTAYAGQGYCVALGLIGTEECARHLQLYLQSSDDSDHQDWAIGALTHIQGTPPPEFPDPRLWRDGTFSRITAFLRHHRLIA